VYIAQRPGFIPLYESEKALVRKFRHSQKTEKDLFVKLLKSTRWDQEDQRTDVLDMMGEWAPLNLDHAFALLSGFFCVNDVYTMQRVSQECTPEI
jgi:hypothetical protein